ncbi:putative B3 domain-containing protein REM15-like [Capsicum annuum]|nr:putative B3 domain-containing protein REM15-like [Capsicum annuum]
MNGRRLEDGWEKFVEEHDLQLGDILIFRHEGDMDFDVSIFDSTHCDTEYAEYKQIQEEKDKRVEDENEDDEVVEEEEQEEDDDDDEDDEVYTLDRPFGRSHFEFTIRQYCLSKENAMEKPKPNVMSSHKDFPDVETAKDMPRGRPRFIYTITASCISKYFLHVPRQFARENGLRDRKCIITIRDEQQRPWVFKLYTATGNTFIAGGWRNFCAANFLMEGDRLITFFICRANASLQPEEKKPNLDAVRVFTQDKGRRLKTSSMTTPESQVAASTSVDVNSHFISTIKPYTIKNSTLYLPLDFAKSNGLMDKSEMILVDEKQRSWSVWLGRMGHHFGILRGWTQFKKANGVQVGDTYKFELTYNGTIPIVHFHCKYSGKDAVVDGQKETSH